METGPSRKGYWVGAALILVGVVGAVLWFVFGFMSFSDTIDDFQRVPVNGEGEVTFDDTGGYVLYFEGPGASDGDVPAGQAQLTPVAGGESLELESYDSELSYSMSGHSGVAVLTVDIEEPGTYLLESESDGSGELAVGRSVGSKLVTTVVGGLALGALGVMSGIVILIVTAVRRRGARPKNAPWIPPPPPA
ncbi:MAG TPA: hypothetical protein VF244_01905 [Acidimicrobiales bacterium]